jgi:hypothetical protein
MRLAGSDAARVAAAATDAALLEIQEKVDCLLDEDEYQRIGDDIHNGFARVLRAVEFR